MTMLPRDERQEDEEDLHEPVAEVRVRASVNERRRSTDCRESNS